MSDTKNERPEIESEFCKSLSPVGRILEDLEYNVWGTSPIYGPDGKVHVFYSRWKNEAEHIGWLSCCEIAHAVADNVAGPYETVDVAITGRGGDWWDSMTCHNPTIHKVGEKYALFYMGNSDGHQRTKRVGVATSDSLYGPWERCDQPIIEPDPDPNAWNSMITSNPALLQHPNGELWLYYKSWCTKDWDKDIATDDWRNTHRTYGVAIAKDLNGPWEKRPGGPLINLREKVTDAQCEDAYAWHEDGKFKLIMRDMGIGTMNTDSTLSLTTALTGESRRLPIGTPGAILTSPRRAHGERGASSAHSCSCETASLSTCSAPYVVAPMAHRPLQL